MEQAMAAPAAAQPSGDLGFLARWGNIYFSPKKTFEAVKLRPFWVVPMVLLILLGSGFYFWTSRARLSDTLEKMHKNERLMSLPAEQQQEIFDRVERQFKSPFWSVVGVVVAPIFFFLPAGILFFIGNVLMGGEARYVQILGAYVYTGFIGIPEMLVKGFLAAAKGTMNTPLSLAAFFPADQSETFAYRLVNGFDIFSIWFVAVLVVGLATVYNLKTGKVAGWIVPLWILWKVAFAALSGLGMMFGG